MIVTMINGLTVATAATAAVAMAMAVAVTMVMTVVVLMMIWSDIANDNTAILLSRIGIEDSDCPTHN